MARKNLLKGFKKPKTVQFEPSESGFCSACDFKRI